MRRGLFQGFRFDAGWLFLVSGLLLLAAMIVLPAEADVRALDAQVQELEREEARLADRLAAHASFIESLHASEPAFLERLAATQLNLVPEDAPPILLIRARNESVHNWIEHSVPPRRAASTGADESLLARLATGGMRLWLVGASILCIFFGMILSDSASSLANTNERMRTIARPAVGVARAHRPVRKVAVASLDVGEPIDGPDAEWVIEDVTQSVIDAPVEVEDPEQTEVTSSDVQDETEDIAADWDDEADDDFDEDDDEEDEEWEDEDWEDEDDDEEDEDEDEDEEDDLEDEVDEEDDELEDEDEYEFDEDEDEELFDDDDEEWDEEEEEADDEIR